jgi:hypothetical protein
LDMEKRLSLTLESLLLFLVFSLPSKASSETSSLKLRLEAIES